CESASRLLFLSMHWARSIPAFQALGQDCNTSLVRACWNELFTLGLAQCAQVMSLSTILAAIVNHLQNSIQEDKLSGDRIKQVMEHIWKLQEFCNSMAKLDIDGYEYAYLKAIVLFSPDHPGLTSTSQIEKFQEKAQMELQDYVQKTYSEDTYRSNQTTHSFFPKIFLMCSMISLLLLVSTSTRTCSPESGNGKHGAEEKQNSQRTQPQKVVIWDLLLVAETF
ncbi:NR2C2 isoform 11, partial [Pan troglodytes]